MTNLKIRKPYEHLRIYEVVDESGSVQATFDDYNHQKPRHHALEFIKQTKLIEQV